MRRGGIGLLARRVAPTLRAFPPSTGSGRRADFVPAHSCEGSVGFAPNFPCIQPRLCGRERMRCRPARQGRRAGSSPAASAPAAPAANASTASARNQPPHAVVAPSIRRVGPAATRSVATGCREGSPGVLVVRRAERRDRVDVGRLVRQTLQGDRPPTAPVVEVAESGRLDHVVDECTRARGDSGGRQVEGGGARGGFARPLEPDVHVGDQDLAAGRNAQAGRRMPNGGADRRDVGSVLDLEDGHARPLQERADARPRRRRSGPPGRDAGPGPPRPAAESSASRPPPPAGRRRPSPHPATTPECDSGPQAPGRTGRRSSRGSRSAAPDPPTQRRAAVPRRRWKDTPRGRPPGGRARGSSPW